MTNACGIQDPQGAIALRAPLLEIERVIGRTAERPVGLRSERGAGKAMGKGGTGPLRWPIDDGRQGCFRWFRLVSRGSFDFLLGSKFGRTQLRWRELLPQF